MAEIYRSVRRTCIISITIIFMSVYVAAPIALAEGDTSGTAAAETSTTNTTPVSEPTPTAANPVPEQQTSQPAPATQQPAPSSSPAPQKPKSQPGPTKPTGAEGTAYTYNTTTGMWESEKYIWDPVTHQTKPKAEPNYSYNPSTGMWDTTQWVYNPVTGSYQANVVSVPQSASTTGAPQPMNGQAHSAPTGAPFTALQGYGSGTHKPAAGYFDNFYNNTISNRIASFSQSGDAWVTGNTSGGNALTGDALAMATIINLLQSSAGFNPGNFTSFVSNVYGDVQGDMIIDPAVLAASLSGGSGGPSGDVTINSSANNLIDNEINLDARSGNANVTSNTQAGDAVTGSANAVANVVNMINSIIANNQSFLGTINIYGNLDGDILLPPEQLTKLLASSSGIPTVTLSTADAYDRDISVEFNDTQQISNTVAATAASGDASVTRNTSAGNATTGDALTNVTLLNLTGREIIGTNSLLVFVNVLGSWVGMIMDAPSGSTSAALGGGVTKDGMWLPNADTVTATFDATNTINNNLRLNAQTGDALVEANTLAGNAITGDATASANVLNVINSRFVLSDWFGILFINVFGSWNGSFGVDTASGNPAVPIGGGTSNQSPKVFQFVGNNGSGSGSTYQVRPIAYQGTNNNSNDNERLEKKQEPSAILASASGSNSSGLGAGNEQQQRSGLSPIIVLAIVSVVLGLTSLGVERYIVYRKSSTSV